VQFHPEVTPELFDQWVDHLRHLPLTTQEELRRGAHANPEAARDRAWQLYDMFLAGASR
jgi:hypothetical protein